MRASLPIAVSVLLAACGDATQSHSPAKAHAAAPSSASVAYVDTDIPTTRLLKVLEVAPDPASDARDAAACQRAKGRWAHGYYLGVLIFDHKEPGAVRGAKQCWSQRPLTRLPDAGKPCVGRQTA